MYDPTNCSCSITDQYAQSEYIIMTFNYEIINSETRLNKLE